MGVGGLGVCILCVSVSEQYRDNGEGVVLQELTRLTYTRTHVILVSRWSQSETGGCCDNQWTCVLV